MDINPFQQVLDAETLAADVLHLALVLLVQRLHDEVYKIKAPANLTQLAGANPNALINGESYSSFFARVIRAFKMDFCRSITAFTWSINIT